jgi:hypothetical protein
VRPPILAAAFRSSIAGVLEGRMAGTLDGGMVRARSPELEGASI